MSTDAATRILVVEDNEGDAEIVAEHLVEVPGGNFELERAATLNEACALVADTTYDCILLDLDLPDAKGLAALPALKQAAPAVPIVVLTGQDDELTAHQAIHDQAQDYLVKHEVSGYSLDRAIRYAIERNRVIVANEQLRELDLAKSRFIAAFSHEFRTPLNAIGTYVELLEEEIYGPLSERQRGGVRSIRECSDHLMTVINDILDLSSIESGEIPLEIEATHVAELCEELADHARSLARGKSVSIGTDVDPEISWVRTDPRRLRQIMLNLVSNAVKYTDEGSIAIVAQLGNRRVELSVVDTGIGIPKAELPRVFDAFFQVDPERGAASQATGLGLYVSKRLADAIGAVLTADSVAGQGSAFTLLLPLNPPARDRRRSP